MMPNVRTARNARPIRWTRSITALVLLGAVLMLVHTALDHRNDAQVVDPPQTDSAEARVKAPALPAPTAQISKPARESIARSSEEHDPLSVDRSGDESQYIELTVLDAATRTPLSGIRVHLLQTMAFPELQNVEHRAGEMIIGPSPTGTPHSRIVALPAKAEGTSPVSMPRQARSNAWITADGYGWANWHVERGCPENVTVLLEPAAQLDVVIEGDARGAQPFVRVEVFDEGGIAPIYQADRPASDRRIEFRGVPPGRAEIRASVPGNMTAVNSAVRYGGTATTTIPDRGVASVTVELKPSAAELRLRFLVPLDEAHPQRINAVRLKRMSPGGERTEGVQLESAGREGSFEVLVPRRLPAALPGTATVTVSPHGYTEQREIADLARTIHDRTTRRLNRVRGPAGDSECR